MPKGCAGTTLPWLLAVGSPLLHLYNARLLTCTCTSWMPFHARVLQGMRWMCKLGEQRVLISAHQILVKVSLAGSPSNIGVDQLGGVVEAERSSVGFVGGVSYNIEHVALDPLI